MSSGVVSRLGFSVLATGEKDGQRPVANIVFIHGLRGHPQHTWEQEPCPPKGGVGKVKYPSRFLSWRTHKSSEALVRGEHGSAGSAPAATYWPRDLLPRTIPDARILTFGYDADVVGGLFKGASKNNITQHGQDLMLKLEREVEGEPIVFIAHSLGGILVKEGLHWSKSHITPRYRQLHHNTRHVVFLGVPHRGSQMANGMGETLTRLATASLRDTNKHLLSSLDVENELLDRINTEFMKIVQLSDFSVYSFQEGSGLTGLKGFSGKVVSDFSSKLDNALEIVETVRGNHMEMARFSDANDEGYRTVSRVIARCVIDSQQDHKRDRPSAGSTLDNSSPAIKAKRICRIPYISHNSFIGREKELQFLKSNLDDSTPNEQQRRVVVWGPGGAGKTQLVSTYAFRSQSKYSAVFWVTASSEVVLRKSFAEIAIYLGLALPSGGDQQTVIDSVKNWFTDHEQGDWLLVIDNADQLDEVNIQSVIPPINRGSVIITSRNREAAPLGIAIELGEMDTEDAVALLFSRADIKHPTSMEEVTGAQITKLLGYLALAIEHAGAYIYSVGGTLQDYLQQFETSKRDTLEQAPAISMHKESVLETFNLSFKAVMKRNMDAAKLLCFIGFLDAEGVPEDLLTSTDARLTFFRKEVVADQKGVLQAVRLLLSFSLVRVKVESGKKTISLHSLVHYLSRARMNIENQWLWKGKSLGWLIELSVTANADMVHFPHVREQMRQMKELQNFPADSRKRKCVIHCLALLQNHYMFAWQNYGAMEELYEYSKKFLEVLEEDMEDQEHLFVIAMISLINVQVSTVQFTSSNDTVDQILLRHLLKQMTLSAKAAYEHASDDQKQKRFSSNIARPQTLGPSENPVNQNDLMALHTLTTALTKIVDSGSLGAEDLTPTDGKAVQEPVNITLSKKVFNKKQSEGSYDKEKHDSWSTTTNEPVPNNRVFDDTRPPRPESPTVNLQTTERKHSVNGSIPSETKPAEEEFSFKPRYINEVFVSITPPVRIQYLLGLLSTLIGIHYRHGRVAEADLLTMYSTLPMDSISQPDYTLLEVSQLLIEGSRHAASGDVSSMLSTCLQIISIDDNSTEAQYMSLDYGIIMNKLGRPEEAERIVKQTFYKKRMAGCVDPIKLDQDLARDLQSAYVWIKKTLPVSLRLQGHPEQSLQTLLQTLQTAQAVFGVNSLSSLHAALLLYRFYHCHCRQTQLKVEYETEANKYMEILLAVLEQLYCSARGDDGKQVCNEEGLKMSLILWTQGAVEETVVILQAFAQLTGRIMGEDNALSRKTMKALAIAEAEWDICRKERAEDVLKFGTIVFPRKMEDFALALGEEGSS